MARAFGSIVTKVAHLGIDYPGEVGKFNDAIFPQKQVSPLSHSYGIPNSIHMAVNIQAQ